MMKKLISSVLIATTLSMSGCAAMFDGTSQQVNIRSADDAQAKIYVNNAFIGKGNASTVFMKKDNYVVTVESDGCDPVNVNATKSIDAKTFLGLFIDWGIFSILVFDGVGTGAWQQFDQTNYIIPSQCKVGE